MKTVIVVGDTWADCQREIENLQDKCIVCTALNPVRGADGKWYSKANYILRK